MLVYTLVVTCTMTGSPLNNFLLFWNIARILHFIRLVRWLVAMILYSLQSYIICDTSGCMRLILQVDIISVMNAYMYVLVTVFTETACVNIFSLAITILYSDLGYVI